MFDNGLLEYYRTLGHKNGFLNTSKLDYETSCPREYYRETLSCLKTEKGLFYAKKTEKPYSDAEILLSQVYKKAGIDSAIYLPAYVEDMGKCVVSNNVEEDDACPANRIFYLIQNQNPLVRDSNVLPFYKDYAPVDFLQYFTKQCLREYIKMRLFDTASFNTDRHGGNFFFKLKDDKAQSVITYDHGASGTWAFFDFMEGITKRDSISYINGLGDRHCKNRDEMMMQFNENETITDIIPPNEMANELGEVDFLNTAKEIKEATGYSVNQKYADILSKSFDEMAGELSAIF